MAVSKSLPWNLKNKNMKALQFNTYGPPGVLTIADHPKPEPRKGEVLVQIRATAINPSDVKNVAGHFKSPLPRVPGRDYAGVVVGGDAKNGLEVWGSGAGFGAVRDDAHTEYIVVPADSIAPKPPRLSTEQAAAIGVPYLAAWSALVTAGKVQAGETVLVVGDSGAVGRAATQIAHWKKARVIGADIRSENTSKADTFISADPSNLSAEVGRLTSGKGADLVLDTVGGPLFEPSLKSLCYGGRQISIASTQERRVCFDLIDFYHNASRLAGVDTMKLTGAEIARIMNELCVGFQAGHLHAPAITTWPFASAVEAYEVVEKGGSAAKHILIPDAAS
jgi:NADPH:quinone reductase-like Zn-dependent oxidoreductase